MSGFMQSGYPVVVQITLYNIDSWHLQTKTKTRMSNVLVACEFATTSLANEMTICLLRNVSRAHTLSAPLFLNFKIKSSCFFFVDMLTTFLDVSYGSKMLAYGITVAQSRFRLNLCFCACPIFCLLKLVQILFGDEEMYRSFYRETPSSRVSFISLD